MAEVLAWSHFKQPNSVLYSQYLPSNYGFSSGLRCCVSFCAPDAPGLMKIYGAQKILDLTPPPPPPARFQCLVLNADLTTQFLQFSQLQWAATRLLTFDPLRRVVTRCGHQEGSRSCGHTGSGNYPLTSELERAKEKPQASPVSCCARGRPGLTQTGGLRKRGLP